MNIPAETSRRVAGRPQAAAPSGDVACRELPIQAVLAQAVVDRKKVPRRVLLAILVEQARALGKSILQRSDDPVLYPRIKIRMHREAQDLMGKSFARLKHRRGAREMAVGLL